MRNVRSIASQSPAVVISLLALFFALGSGAGYAATTAAGPAASRVATMGDDSAMGFPLSWTNGPADHFRTNAGEAAG